MDTVVLARRMHGLMFREILLSQTASNVEAIDALFEEIVRRYFEPHRGHHTNEHIAEVHALLELHGRNLEEAEALFVAVEFHDVIYNLPGDLAANISNEDASMAFAAERLRALGVSAIFMEKVLRFIESTKVGECCRTEDERLLHDADYWVLGSVPKRYWKYSRGVAREYLSERWPEVYRAGRAAFLQSQIEKRAVFETPTFELMFGARALLNMTWELETLMQQAFEIGLKQERSGGYV